MSYTCKQNIKEIKNGCNCRNQKFCLLGRKCLLPNTAEMSIHWKHLLWTSRKIHQIISSTTLPNSLSFKITQTAQNYRKNTGKLNAHNIIWLLRKHYSSLHKNLEINSYKGNNLLNKRPELISYVLSAGT